MIQRGIVDFFLDTVLIKVREELRGILLHCMAEVAHLYRLRLMINAAWWQWSLVTVSLRAVVHILPGIISLKVPVLGHRVHENPKIMIQKNYEYIILPKGKASPLRKVFDC